MTLNKFLLISISICFTFPVVCLSQTESNISADIKNTGKIINSAFADFAPVIASDGSKLYFTSRRPVTEKELKSGKSAKERVFISHYNSDSGTWSVPVSLSATINAAGRNNSAASVSKNGQKLLLFRDDYKGNGDIYESSLIGSEWSDAIRLPEPVNSPYHESSACYSSDGNTIYFISNRKGGMGGRDIWYCTKDQNDTWGAAINLGSPVNTAADEEGLYLNAEGNTIFFSSKSHGTTGGYDIFKSTNHNGKWSTPQTIHRSVNNARNDIFYVDGPEENTGYFSSDRQGGIGDSDIYMVKFSAVKTETIPKINTLKGVVFDNVSRATLNSEVVLMNNETGEKVESFTTTDENGQFQFSVLPGKNYSLQISSPGYLFTTETLITANENENNVTEKNVGLNKLEVGSKIVLNNIFYDFNKATLSKESIAELEQLFMLLTENANLKIELSSHTDSIGGDDYNNRLSLARAQSVVDYLTGKGISKTRLTAKGHGKSMPVASNDTEEGRQLNRRTEFSILSK